MIGYEYLDHPADIQLHGYGPSLASAFEQTALAMMNYSCPLDLVGIDSSKTQTIEIEGSDLENCLFRFLDEILFLFQTDFFITKHISDLVINTDSCSLKCTLKGEVFKRDKHEGGADIKAITYSAMRIENSENVWHCYVVVDI
ncbi:hypothetical protein P9112_011128 [Eukaryota sp. TZLM1-RC]